MVKQCMVGHINDDSADWCGECGRPVWQVKKGVVQTIKETLFGDPIAIPQAVMQARKAKAKKKAPAKKKIVHTKKTKKVKKK